MKLLRFVRNWNFKKKRVCIIYGNCVAGVLDMILKGEKEFADAYEIVYTRSFVHPLSGPPGVPIDKIKQCSLFLCQYGHLQYPGFLDDLPSSCRTISFPVMRWPCLWPLERRDPRSKPEKGKFFFFGRYPYGRYPYGDRLVMRLLKKGLTPDEIFKRYFSRDINSVINLDELYKKNMRDGKELDAKCDLTIYRYVEQNFTKERLFWTPNHPCPGLLIMQANQIKEKLGMKELSGSVLSRIIKNPPFATYHLPIHPQVIRHFNLLWADANLKYRHYRIGWFTFEEYLKRYIEYK